MPSAGVTITELDLSTRVPSFPGVFGGIVVQSKKGPVNEPVLVTNESQFLASFTPDESIVVGDDLGMFSALTYLQKSDKLWVVRAAKDAYYAGASIKRSDASTTNQTLPAGQMLSDPSAYVFDSNPDVVAVAEVTDVTIPVTGVTADVAGAGLAWTLEAPEGAHYVWYNVTDGGNAQSDPALGGTGVQVDILAADTANDVATKTAAALDLLAAFSCPAPAANIITVTNATVGAVTDAADVTAGVTVSVTTQGVDEVNLTDEVMLIHAANQGAWGNDVLVQIITDQAIVKEADAFLIRVYKSSNLATPVEEHLCSRLLGKQDGFGRNIYVEDALLASNFIRAVDNTGVAETILPLPQGLAEKTTVTCVADTAGSLNDTYFLLNTPSQGFYVWYNVAGAGTDPALSGKVGIEVQIATGDGATTNFTGTLANIPVLQNNLIFSSIGANNVGLVLKDVPVHDAVTGKPTSDGNLYTPNTEPAAAPTATLANNTLNYVTGVYDITFDTAPAANEPVYIQASPYVAARPTSVLFFDNKFFVRPVPDQPYEVRIEIYARPTELLNAGQEPELEQWWQYIAFLAARKVLEDRTDFDTIAQIMPLLKEQEMLVERRTLTQQGNERAATIYSDQAGLSGGPGYSFFDGNFQE